MTRSTVALLLWTPRVLALVFAGFLSLFALDVFGEGADLSHTVTALAMHLIPAAVVLAVLAVAWRWPKAGGVLFVLAGAAYSVTAGRHVSWIVVIGGPLVVVGALFFLSAAAARVEHA